MKNTEQALAWIIQILQSNKILFQISGGLAAHAYGVIRELADIDIDIPEDDFERVKLLVAPYITYGPARFQSETWDLLLMTLNYEGQEIDLGGAYTTKIYDQKQQQWINLVSDFSTAQHHMLYGIVLPVIDKTELIYYKKILSRPVDLVDLEWMTR